MLPVADHELIQIVDNATADAAQRSGHWLLCRPGCTQCCIGVFAITQLDALRLQQGLLALEVSDPTRSKEVRIRARQSVLRLTPEFPGDAVTGILNEDDDFEDFANDEPCPALDPATGTCDLYAARPMTCRVFGPPVRSEDGIGICELCFNGASEKDIFAAELNMDWSLLEDSLNKEAIKTMGQQGNTLVAFALNQLSDK